MLHIGDRVKDGLERTGTIMGEVRYRSTRYRPLLTFLIVLWDGYDEPMEYMANVLEKIND